RGPSEFSEPESQAVRDFIVANPNITIMVSYHTFGEMVLYPWGHLTDPVPDGRAHSAMRNMAASMGQMTGYRDMQSADLYPASGDTCDWAYGERGIFCFTFELSPRSSWNGGFYPGAEAIDTTFRANIDPAVYMVDLADDPYRAATKEVASAPSGVLEAGAVAR
ncbi:M14 family zinc carboxypeptidase, partial [Elusimicrobiota bacterium]